MSLVGYDDSSSEEEDEVTKISPAKTEVLPKMKNPGTRSSLVLGPLKVTSTTKNGTTRITAPSLSSSDFGDSDDEDPKSDPKRLKTSDFGGRKSGLLMKLPAPMNAARSKQTVDDKFLPYVLTNRKGKNSANENATDVEDRKDVKKDSSSRHTHVPSIAELKKRSAQAAQDLLLAKKSSSIQKDMPDHDVVKDEDETGVGFFSFSDKVQEDRSLENVSDSAIKINLKPDVADAPFSANASLLVSNELNVHDTTYSTQDHHEFLRIQGKRNRNENVDFIEIRQDDAMEGSKEMLLKQISEEKDLQRMSSKNRNATGGAMKRKHQLPYLIEQAKTREIELKNTWAQNRLSKQQTQSKYGW